MKISFRAFRARLCGMTRSVRCTITQGMVNAKIKGKNLAVTYNTGDGSMCYPKALLCM